MIFHSTVSYCLGQGLIRAMEMDVIPPRTHVDVYAAYDIMLKIRDRADILLPLHEPAFASGEAIG